MSKINSKNVFIVITLLVMILVGFSSCEKDESNLTKNEELLTTTWSLINWYETIDGVTTTIFPNPDYETAKAEMEFKDDGTFIGTVSISFLGFTKKEERSGEWSFNEDETKLIMTSIEFKSSLMKVNDPTTTETLAFDIIELTKTNLHLKFDEAGYIEEIIAEKK